mmetsp:Transcript_53455/g.44855  ORF Transcript_53455/g.44855 Transcript_53455/m.44855 type:complete len:204 (+) Transcript_53455:253-864(+)
MFEEIAARWCQRWGVLNWVFADHLKDLHEVGRHEGYFAVCQHIERDSTRPDIRGLAAEVALGTCLGCRECWCARGFVDHIVVVFQKLRSAKIGKFQLSIGGEQQVFGFDISVDEFICVHVFHSHHQIFEKFPRHFFRERIHRPIAGHTLPSITQLDSQKEFVVLRIVEDLVELDTVGVIHHLHDADLVLDILDHIPCAHALLF